MFCPTVRRLEQNVSYSGQSSLRRSGKNALHTHTHTYVHMCCGLRRVESVNQNYEYVGSVVATVAGPLHLLPHYHPHWAALLWKQTSTRCDHFGKLASCRSVLHSTAQHTAEFALLVQPSAEGLISYICPDSDRVAYQSFYRSQCLHAFSRVLCAISLRLVGN